MEEQNSIRRQPAKELQSASARTLLRADVGIALAEEGNLKATLQRCSEAIVRHLEGVAVIWTLNRDENVLELQASAGAGANFEDSHRRVPVGELAIGLVAHEKRAHLTNDVINDSLISDKDWAKREGMIAFAGHPLLIEGRLVGAMALFSRKSLTLDIVDALAPVADILARGIEHKRQDNAQRKQSLAMETTTDGIAILNQCQVYTYVNEAHAKIYGYDCPEELIGKDWRVLYYEDEIRRCQEEALPVVWETGRWRGELIGKRRDGRTFDVEISLTSLQDGDFICVCRDISERKRAEEAIRRYAKRLETLQEIDRAILAEDSPEAIAKAALRHLWQLVPCQRASVMEIDGRSGEGIVRAVHTKGEITVPTGARLPLETFGSPEELRQGKVQMVDNAHTVRETPFIKALITAGLRSWINVPLISQGELIGTLNLGWDSLGVVSPEHVDITREIADSLAIAIRNARLHEQVEHHAADLERRVAERTAELEAFSYSVSHDLRTPLLTIDGFCRMLLEDYSDKLDAEGRRLLDVICSNSQNMSRLIDDLLAFSRLGLQEMRPKEVNMGELAEAVFEELTSTRPERALKMDLKLLPPAHGDQAMLHQVFVNLFSNSLKFTALRERALIEVGSSVKENQNIYYVKDNGVGFEMKYADKLFGVFQRLHTEKEFAGTGVGLALVQRIIQRHGGRVWAEGKTDEGATIYFALPREPIK